MVALGRARENSEPPLEQCGRHRPSQRPEWIHEHHGSHDKHRRREDDPPYHRDRYLESPPRPYAAPAGSTARFSNDAAGLRKLIAWIGPQAGRIAYARTLAPRLRGGAAEGRASPVRDQSLPGPVLRQVAGTPRQDRRRRRPDGDDGGRHRRPASDRGKVPQRRRTATRARRAADGPPSATAANTCASPSAQPAAAGPDRAPAQTRRSRDPLRPSRGNPEGLGNVRGTLTGAANPRVPGGKSVMLSVHDHLGRDMPP